MHKKIIIFLFILYSCNYPDIDTVPKFDSLIITMEEVVDKCRITNIININKENCIKEYKNIIDRL